MTPATIRLATPADLAAINDIFNYYVLHCTCTYQEEPETAAGRAAWFASHDARHPITVAELAGQVVGWGALSQFRLQAAYRHTVENSVYIHPEFHRRGIGRALLADLIQRGRAAGHHAILALISAEQAPSLALHAAFGFQQVAHLREVGFKHRQWLDVIYMELPL